MAPQKQTTLMQWVQIILTLVIIPYVGYVHKSLADVNDKIGEIKVFMATSTTEQKNDHSIVSEYRLKVMQIGDKQENHESRISVIEAILPESLRKRKRDNY